MQVKSSGNLGNLIRSGQDVYIEKYVFKSDVDLIGMLEKNLISEGVFQVKTTSSITFKDCTFEGKLTAFKKTEGGESTLATFLSNVSFINCRFDQEVTFRGSSIMGRADFTKSAFFGEVNFEECSFYQNAYFTGCVFREELRFHNAFFMQKANFMNAEFRKVSSFQNASFQSELQFSVAKFQGYADFSLARFGGNTFFNYAEFSDQSIFSNALFNRNLDFISVQFKNGDFKKCVFQGETRFTQSKVAERLNFENSFFFFGQPEFKEIPSDKLDLRNVK